MGWVNCGVEVGKMLILLHIFSVHQKETSTDNAPIAFSEIF